MRIGPLFKWFGSKWSAAKRGNYPSPKNGCIIEPYCGGAGYSLNYCHNDVLLYDADPNVSELWKWIISDDCNTASVLDIPLNLPVGTDIRTLGLTRGQELLLKHWQRTNNVGDCWTISPWGNKPGQWTANTRARVADEVMAVKHWRFIDDPYLYIDTPATWFIDPPYQYNYRYRPGLGDVPYDSFDSLSQTIHKESLVIFCEAVGKKGEIPTYLPFVASHLQVTSRRKKSNNHHSRELIYVR